jgi:predicted phage replisome organizer
MRLKEDFFDSDEMIVLESLPDGVIYQNILLKMYCRSLKSEGRLMLNGIIPYNPQMLASVTRQQVGTVEKALELFKQLGLIDILDNGAIYMLNIQNYIGTSSTEADRVRKYRDQITTEKQEVCTNVQHLYSRDRDRDRDRDKDRDRIVSI